MIVCSYVRNSLAGRIGCAELVACSPGISLPLGSERGLKRGATLCPSSHPVLVESSAFGKGDRAMKVIGNLDEHTDGCWPALDPVSCHRGRGLLFSVRGPTFFKGVYRLGGRDTEPDERQDHGPDSYMRLGAFADMSAPRAFVDGRTDVPLRTNAMQHCIELVAQVNQFVER